MLTRPWPLFYSGTHQVRTPGLVVTKRKNTQVRDARKEKNKGKGGRRRVGRISLSVGLSMTCGKGLEGLSVVMYAVFVCSVTWQTPKSTVNPFYCDSGCDMWPGGQAQVDLFGQAIRACCFCAASAVRGR